MIRLSLLLTLIYVSTLPQSSQAAADDRTHLVRWGSGGILNGRDFNKPLAQICMGAEHAVALKTDGTVVAWGKNSYGQINVPPGLGEVKSIAAGSFHTVALKTDGTVVAWGKNDAGQIPPAGLSGISAIAAGGEHTIALKNDGSVLAWGDQPEVPAGLADVTAIASSLGHSAALLSSGAVVVWGWYPELNDVPLAALSGVKAITMGELHVVALKTDGTVAAWGLNHHGEATVPSGLNNVKAIAAGYYYTMALLNNGTVVTWGLNDHGQRSVPAGLTGVRSIAAGGSTSVAMTMDDTVTAWGTYYPGFANDVKAVSGLVMLKTDGTVTTWGDTQKPPANLTDVTAIASGPSGDFGVALRSNGTVVAWGSNSYGETSVPVGLENVKAIAAGSYHVLALMTNGTVVAWGYNDSGQTTVPPAALSNVKAIAAGGHHSVVLKNDGSLVTWGANDYGQTDIPAGLSGVTAIAAGSLHTVALKDDGKVVVWGANDYEQKNIPAGLENVKAISASAYHTVALKTDGTVVAWGYNGDGQTDVPPNLSGVESIAAGVDYTAAIIPLAPTISAKPPTVTVTTLPFFGVVGQTFTFTAVAQGMGTLTYQWRRDGQPISGATKSTLSLTNLKLAQEGTYDVVVKNSYGVTLSAPAHLSFRSISYALPTAPHDIRVGSGETAYFFTTAMGPVQPGTFWQWSKDGTVIKGANSSTLIIPGASLSSVGRYSVTITSPVAKTVTYSASLSLSDPGLLIYKVTGTGVSQRGTTSTTGAITGFMILDRARQRGGLIIGRKDGSQSVHSLEVHEGLDIRSTGPVPKSLTVVSEGTEGEPMTWLSGIDSLLTISKTDKTFGPATLKGFMNFHDTSTPAAQPTSYVETINLTLTLDAANSVPARLDQETVEQSMSRLSKSLLLKGSALTE